jgi:biopolymer transport protein TolR
MAVNLGGSTGKKQRAAPNINVTPLVDVVLVVLIIFMIVTPMMIKTFWLNLPKQEKTEKHEPQPTDNKPIVLTVDKAGVIRVNQTVLGKHEVSERIPRMLSAKNQRVLYFDAHDEAAYGRAVEALDLARAGGVKSIAMLTEPILK